MIQTPTLRSLALVASLPVLACAAAGGAPPGSPGRAAAGSSDGWEASVAGLELRSGLLDVYVDVEGGRVLLALPAPGDRGLVGSYLYVEGLATGLGSNPVGLDRGQLGDSKVLDLRRIGRRVLFEEPNLAFRALTEDAAEARAAREAFATSVVWAGDAEVVTADGRSLVDITTFLVRDAHGVVERLAQTEQGVYRLDATRSVVDFDACLAFPDNLEFEALLTFDGDGRGAHLRNTAPTATAISLVQHHSLVRLPDAGYRPRPFDPRMGSFEVSFLDYAAPLDEPIRRQWIVRHRLERADPTAPTSPAKEPIVYYVDPGAPEPVRSALVEGAAWWADAFAAAGFEDAFRVEILPPGAHPLDVRYNVIQWVHRSTRGWSYGGGVIDPRTGEMLKGHVSLGSLRIRQDILLVEGLVGAGRTGNGAADDPIEVALARIRQLSAHEVGHTLGFNHNFAASSYDRASVMDYPAPWIRPTEDGLDLGDAYAAGIGDWDRHCTDWAYREFPPGVDEAAALAEIVDRGLAQGMIFLSDADARPPGAAQPLAALWDNGDDPVAALRETLEVRRRGLDAFGEENIAPGRPLALLEEVLAPLYFHHRYQLEAAIKVIGGIDYRYKVRGDSQALPAALPAERQREALSVVLGALSPAALAVPDKVTALMHPRASGSDVHNELFGRRTGPTFDPVAAAASAAELLLELLWHPERLTRVAELHARDAGLPAVAEILDGAVATAFADTPSFLDEVSAAVREVTVRRLAVLAADATASVSVRAAAEEALARLPAAAGDPVAAYLQRSADRWLGRRLEASAEPDPAPDPPPGPPIGAAPHWAGGCSWPGMGER